MRIERFLPIILKSPNVQEHWTVKRKRHLSWQKMVDITLRPKIFDIQLPVEVTLVKVGGRKMDAHDNLPFAFKSIVDAIAVLLTGDERKGKGDNDPRITWKYAHRPRKKEQPGIEIIIEEIQKNSPPYTFSIEEITSPFL